MSARIAAGVTNTAHTAGADAFADLLAACERRGWRIEHDAELPFYGPYWIVAPHGEFIGHGFGRADSLGIAYRAALAAWEDE